MLIKMRKLVAGSLLVLMCVSSPHAVLAEGTVTPNFKNVDIESLIGTIAKHTGKNFVIDPRVKAKVTIVSSSPMDAKELYEVFLSALQVHGYSAVPSGNVIKIVPDVTAKQGPVPELSSDVLDSDQLVTHVFKIQHVPAAQLVPILRPLVPQQGHLAAYAATNSLIITDRGANINRIRNIINRIDRPDSDEVEVVALRHASASEVVRILNSLQARSAQGVSTPGSVRLAADERTNGVLISGDRSSRLRIRALIANLDTPLETGGNTRVVYLRYASAKDLLNILKGVSQGQAKVGVSSGTGNTGNKSSVPVQSTPQPVASSVSNRSNNNNKKGDNVDIQADEHTNSLIITAPPDAMKNILAVIRQLDIRRAQVLVEAIIAEISESKARALGASFGVNGSDSGDRPIGYSNLGGGLNELAGAVANPSNPALSSGFSMVLGQSGSGGVDFGFLLRAIASDAKNNILSTPSIVTVDNQEAEIVVGSNVPFVTGSQLSSSNSNPFQTIERKDVGLTLKVKPQINEGDTIKMEISQEVSNVDNGANTRAADIITSRRSINTTVLVEDGQTLVLGGLIDENQRNSYEKVPLLGDIPIIGKLFQYRNSDSSKRNLMVFIRPVILRDPHSGSLKSGEKYSLLRAQQMEMNNDKRSLLQGDVPVLPELIVRYIPLPENADQPSKAKQSDE